MINPKDITIELLDVLHKTGSSSKRTLNKSFNAIWSQEENIGREIYKEPNAFWDPNAQGGVGEEFIISDANDPDTMNSVQIGDKIRIKGSEGAPDSPKDGDMWVKDGRVHIFSGGKVVEVK